MLKVLNCNLQVIRIAWMAFYENTINNVHDHKSTIAFATLIDSLKRFENSSSMSMLQGVDLHYSKLYVETLYTMYMRNNVNVPNLYL